MSARVTITLDELILLKADARGFSFLPRQPVHSLLAGRHASRLRGRGLAFEELRHYQPGDDVRTIDWRATARRGSAHVRVYNEERERPVLLVVDQRTPDVFRQPARDEIRRRRGAGRPRCLAYAARRRSRRRHRFQRRRNRRNPPAPQPDRVLRLLHEVVRFNQVLASDEHGSRAR